MVGCATAKKLKRTTLQKKKNTKKFVGLSTVCAVTYLRICPIVLHLFSQQSAIPWFVTFDWIKY